MKKLSGVTNILATCTTPLSAVMFIHITLSFCILMWDVNSCFRSGPSKRILALPENVLYTNLFFHTGVSESINCCDVEGVSVIFFTVSSNTGAGANMCKVSTIFKVVSMLLVFLPATDRRKEQEER